MAAEVDLRAALNAVSDVVQNRPLPIREFDQIYMKSGDMVMQSEFVASWSKGKRLAFIGDGDAISVCVAYLHARGVVDYGPTLITVFDFDERIVSAINRFADKERLSNLEGRLYNCLDAFPTDQQYDLFYTNPPWGASNGGESVNVFAQRGFEATGFRGEGLVVIADDAELDWPSHVLYNVQSYAFSRGYYVSRMTPQLHSYHLDDAPNLRSCNLTLRARPGNSGHQPMGAVVDPRSLDNFYGRDRSPRVRYVREIKRLDYGKANGSDYQLETIGSNDAS